MLEQMMQLLLRGVVALEIIARSFIKVQPAQEEKEYQESQRRQEAEKARDAIYNKQAASRRMSTIADLSAPTPVAIEKARAASVEFAINGLKVPWSEAHMRALMEYEHKVEQEFGEGSSMQLPWRQVIPRGEDTVR